MIRKIYYQIFQQSIGVNFIDFDGK